MAFITVSPMSGQGDSTLTVTAAKHTGRSTRTSSFTVACKNDATAKATVSVTQSAAAAFLNSVTSSPTVSQNTAIPVTYSFKSNSATFYIYLFSIIESTRSPIKDFSGGTVQDMSIRVNGTALSLSSGVAGTTGVKFTTAAGTDVEYTVTVSFTIRASATAFVDIGWEVGAALTDTATQSEQNLSNRYTSTKAKASLSVTPTSVPSVAAAGGNSSVKVTTNDEWAVTIS